MAEVCREIQIGHGSPSIPEIKVVRHGLHFRYLHRTSSMHVYATFCGPNNAVNQILGDLTACGEAAAIAAGISTIIAGPEAALPAFLAAFEPCLTAKVGHQAASEIHIGLSAKFEPDGDWH